MLDFAELFSIEKYQQTNNCEFVTNINEVGRHVLAPLDRLSVDRLTFWVDRLTLVDLHG
jgi:hypothetical protein